MSMEEMGYQNANLVYALSSIGRLNKPRGGKLAVNTMAIATLTYMALNTYDWPPTEKLRQANLPCRYYTLGWRAIYDALGMGLLSQEQVSDADIDVDAAIKARERTAQTRISQTWKYLQDQKLIKCLQPASLGKNAGYLLLLGTDEENREVEAYARECLSLSSC